MPTTITSLHDLRSYIDQHEQNLRQMREELKARQSLLTSLEREKAKLIRDLEKLDAEIAKVNEGGISVKKLQEAFPKPAGSFPHPTDKAKPSARHSKKKMGKKGQRTLFEYIKEVLGEAERPMSPKAIANAVLEAGFPTTSTAPHRTVTKKVYFLAKKGLLEKHEDSTYSLSEQAIDTSPEETGEVGETMTGAAPSSNGATKPSSSIPLREAILIVLRRSKKPIDKETITERLFSVGYHSDSENLVRNVASMLGRMKEEVDQTPEGEYALR